MGATQYCGEPQSLNIVQARWACSEVVSWVKASGATIADAWKALKRYFLLPNGYKLPIEVQASGKKAKAATMHPYKLALHSVSGVHIMRSVPR